MAWGAATDATSDTTSATTGATSGETGETTGPALPPGEWIEVAPGGDTGCAAGSPYHFFVRGGDPNRVIIDFEGGGACWSGELCGIGAPIYKPSVRSLEDYLSVLELDFIGGLQDVGEPARPMYGWTYVHVPYCTGDIHMGAADVEYDGGVAIQHRGAANARSALDWVLEHHGALAEVNMSGCSAGSYGAYFHAPYMAERLPESSLRVLGDGGVGVLMDGFFALTRAIWGVQMPDEIPRLHEDEIDAVDLFAGVAQAYPDHRFALHTTAFDADQTFYFTAMGGDAEAWPGLARALLETARGEADNLRTILAPGPTHCVTPYEHLWTRSVEGVTLEAWLEPWLHADAAPGDLDCANESCLEDPLCASCEPDDVRDLCDYCAGWPP